MSGLEVVGAVAAVISAFHGGSELVKAIRKRRNKKRSQKQAVQEEMLYESLQTGQSTVAEHYATDVRELGQLMRRGDDTARDRLLHIAVIMQAEIIRSLQIAIKYENVILDLTMLQDASTLNRYNTVSTLDELRQRLLTAAPIPAPLNIKGVSLQPPTEPAPRASIESVRTYLTAQTVASDYVPSAVTIPEPEAKGSIGRFLSTRRTPSGLSKDFGSSRISLLPNFDWLIPAISKSGEVDFTSDMLRSLSIAAKSDSSGPRVARMDSTSTRSTYSDRLSEPSIYESTGSASPRPTPSPRDSNLYSPASERGSIAIPDNEDPFQQYNFTRQPQLTARGRVSSVTSSLNTSVRTATLQTKLGRPSKDNNYWGFCKGAWVIQEDVTRGIKVQMVPHGMYGTRPTWQCRECDFRGAALGTKKPYAYDTHVHVHPVSGIAYRWLFLAKSHVKKKSLGDGSSSSYGCRFCIEESKGEKVFGNAKTLMTHIWDEHAKPGIGQDILDKTGCVFGRVANTEEQFDINIPTPNPALAEPTTPAVVMDLSSLSYTSSQSPVGPGPSSSNSQSPIEVNGSSSTGQNGLYPRPLNTRQPPGSSLNPVEMGVSSPRSQAPPNPNNPYQSAASAHGQRMAYAPQNPYNQGPGYPTNDLYGYAQRLPPLSIHQNGVTHNAPYPINTQFDPRSQQQRQSVTMVSFSPDGSHGPGILLVDDPMSGNRPVPFSPDSAFAQGSRMPGQQQVQPQGYVQHPLQWV